MQAQLDHQEIDIDRYVAQPLPRSFAHIHPLMKLSHIWVLFPLHGFTLTHTYRDLEGLRSHVGRLKQMGHAIHEESQMQNALLAQLVRSIPFLTHTYNTSVYIKDLAGIYIVRKREHVHDGLISHNAIQEEGFEKAKLALGSARKRLDRAMVQVKGNHMLTLVLFAALLLFAVWLFKKILWWI